MKRFLNKMPQILFTTLSLVLAVSITDAKIDDVLRVNQGLNATQLSVLYNEYEGSQLMPLNWFLVLENQNSGVKFRDGLQNYGLIDGGQAFLDSRRNPYRLPMGMTVGKDPRTTHLYGEAQWVGLNCAACHSGMIEIGNKKVIIEGGSSLFDIQKFEVGILNAMKATLSDKEKLNRFIQNLKTKDERSLLSNMKKFVTEFSGWVERNHNYISSVDKSSIPFGPGRIDGLGGPTNDLTCYLTDRIGDENLKRSSTDPRNCASSQAPTSLPHLWGMTRQDFVQWTGNVHTAIGRNYGQATGTYAKNWIERDFFGTPKYRSTTSIPSLNRLEDMYRKLQSPDWEDLVAAGVVAPIDKLKVSKGQVHFAKHCASCHAEQPSFTAPNAYGNSYWNVDVIPVEIVGTDDKYLKPIRDRKAFLPPAHTEGFKSKFGPTSVSNDHVVSATYFRNYLIAKMLTDTYRIAELAQYNSCRNDGKQQPIFGYKSRSLEGIGFTAPYLHNGSVPTLDDLLKKTADRPKTFYIGCRNYDVQKMGYDCSVNSTGAFLFDTSLEGNGNQGHEYGVDLSSIERQELIEYIKSLKEPTAPPNNKICY